MDASSKNTSSTETETAVFAAGCFWGIEAGFRAMPGVVDTAVGYIGGHQLYPTYKQVCTGRTGHAEAVKITYDPSKISYDDLLAAFWECHDPTQLNRQGPDRGTQYRSAIFPTDDEQRVRAERSRDALSLNGQLPKPIATTIEDPAQFWMAEDYHQQYLEKSRGGASCRL